jgi:hypothetical protein
MPDFPTGLPDIPSAVGTNPLSTFHTSESHAASTNRILTNLLQLATKLGIGSSSPGAASAVLRRTASGQSAWGPIVNADVDAAAAIAYSKLNLANAIVSADIVNGTIATADLAAGAAGLISAVEFGAQSTTSTSAVAIGASSLAGVVSTGKLCLIGFTLYGCGVNAATSGSPVHIYKDGAFFRQLANQVTPAGVYTSVTGVTFDTPSAAAHTWSIAWATTAGCTFSCNAGSLWVAEIRGGP